MARLACQLNAIPQDRRPRYEQRVRELRASILRKDETAEGYRLFLDAKGIGLAGLGEWMEMEHYCCPFLDFELRVGAEREEWELKLGGPDGVKALLEQALFYQM